jgi:hypothetical protein
MDFHQIEVSKAIDVATHDQPFELRNVLGECATRASPYNLNFLIWPIEHFAFTGEVMNGPQDEIELLPVPLHPPAARRRGNWVIIQFNPDQNLNILVLLSQALDDFKVYAGVVAIMIGEGDTPNVSLAGSMNPGLQKLRSIGSDLMSLRVGVVVDGEEHLSET